MKRNPFALLLISGIVFLTTVTYAQENNYITSRYDFIPGEKVIFFDDFTSESIGDFPAQWLTNGSGEIVTSNKFPGRWFNLTKMGYFIPEAKEDFTENFTVEFDFVPITTDNSEVMRGFIFYLLSGRLGEPGGGGEPGDAGFLIYLGDSNLSWKNWTMQNEQRFNGDVVFTFKSNERYHIAIWVQKQRVRLYANENKVLDVPRAIPAGSKTNIFRLESDQVPIPLIGNFRIAAGLPDMRNRLLKDGKIISYGIQFDVNSDKLKPESYSTLKVIADILKEDPSLKLLVVGHTDSDGDDVSNLDLSKRRATSVKNELVTKFAVEAARLETDGKGESEPLTENNSALNKAKNRRVEFINIKEKVATPSSTALPKVTATSPAKVASSQETGSFKDPRDGKEYKTVKTGTQIWMAENIAFKAVDGCWAYDNKESNITTYGYLYNWETAKNVCPSGWHLPSDDEWLILASYLGDKELAITKKKNIAGYSSNNIANKLKSVNLWETSNTAITNETGFTALPGGNRSVKNEFEAVGFYGEWWSSTAYSGSWNIDAAWFINMFHSESRVFRATNAKSMGLSVRCVKDGN
jgi:OOP family OmpA-OmpF porin